MFLQVICARTGESLALLQGHSVILHNFFNVHIDNTHTLLTFCSIRRGVFSSSPENVFYNPSKIHAWINGLLKSLQKQKPKFLVHQEI